MAQLRQYYLQSLTVNGVSVRREDVVESAYIEPLNLAGPLLILTIRDVGGALIDNGGLKKGSVIVATLGDGAGRYSLFQETFYVVEAPRYSDSVHVTALAADVQKLCIPAAQPRFFVDKQPGEIIRILAPGLTVAADSLAKVGTWHLNMAQKPGAVMRQIATDTGAMCWVARKQINFKLNTNLLQQKASFEYEYNNTKAKYTINKIRNINNDHAATATKEYRYMSYNETEGLKVAGASNLPIKMVSDQDLGVLQNKHITIIPKLDIEVSGNPAIQAGMVLSVILHRYDSINRINESVPKNMVVERVTHYESRFVYITRMILGVPFDPNAKP